MRDTCAGVPALVSTRDVACRLIRSPPTIGYSASPPLYQEVARAYRQPVGCMWSVDETVIYVAGRLQYADRAINEYGQVVSVCAIPTPDAAAATAYFERAVEETDERPEQATTEKAAYYLPALQHLLPEAEHITGKMVQQQIERDHQHPTGRFQDTWASR